MLTFTQFLFDGGAAHRSCVHVPSLRERKTDTIRHQTNSIISARVVSAMHFAVLYRVTVGRHHPPRRAESCRSVRWLGKLLATQKGAHRRTLPGEDAEHFTNFAEIHFYLFFSFSAALSPRRALIISISQDDSFLCFARLRRRFAVVNRKAREDKQKIEFWLMASPPPPASSASHFGE